METYQCMECRGVFPDEDLIRHGNFHVCANCKPLFIQKLSEGALRTGQLRYAGFWRRFVAALIDGLILGVFNFVLNMVVVPMASGMVTPAQSLGLLFLLYGIQIATGVTYETVLIGKYGSTVGKMALQMEVVTATGGQVSYALAFGRYFAKWLSTITLAIGYIIAAFDSEKRALHDHICNTRVVVR